jgi:hypothetical protein
LRANYCTVVGSHAEIPACFFLSFLAVPVTACHPYRHFFHLATVLIITLITLHCTLHYTAVTAVLNLSRGDGSLSSLSSLRHCGCGGGGGGGVTVGVVPGSVTVASWAVSWVGP